jgi:hypothetical protein
MGNFQTEELEGGSVSGAVSAMMDVGFKDSGL